LIDKIHYKLSFDADVSKQSTIHIGCKAIAHIYFNDGRIVEDVKIDWDDGPYLHDPKQFSQKEVTKINNILDDKKKGLWIAAEEMSKIIEKKTIIKTIKVEG